MLFVPRVFPAPIGLTFSLFLLSAVAPVGTAWAQETPTRRNIGSFTLSPQEDAVLLQERLRSQNELAVLPLIVWDAMERGPLLVVNPAQQAPFGRRVPFPKPDPNGQYRLSDLGEYFGRRVVPVGSLSVWAQSFMEVLATRLPEPDGLAFLSPSERIMVLGSTLTDTQWKKLGSANGLGISDLDKKQRHLFLGLLPDTLTLQYSGERPSGQPYPQPVRLSPSDIRNIRLRATRRLDWSFGAVGQPDWRMQIGVGPEPTLPGAAPYRLGALRGQDEGGLGYSMSDSLLYGVKMREVVPSKLKPGQLPFDWSVLTVPVAFGEAKTVGDLVAATAKATGAALYCDPRYRNLPVYFRGNGAQAGDLCRALCWGVQGTWRKVGDRAFILTDDVEGLATRQARLAIWANENAARTDQIKQEALAKLAVTDFGSHITFTEGDPYTLTGTIADKIEAQRHARVSTYKEGPPKDKALLQKRIRALTNEFTPVSALPPAVQEMVERQRIGAEKSRERDENDPNMRNFPHPVMDTKAVRLEVGVQLWFVIPGVGTVPFTRNGSSSHPSDLTLTPRPDQAWGFKTAWSGYTDPKPSVPVLPKTPPTNPKTHALGVAITDAEQIGLLVSGAKRAGFGELWVEVLPNETGTKLLTQTVDEAQKMGLQVRAVVRVLRAFPNDTALVPDRNVLGETWSAYTARRGSETEPAFMGNMTMPKPSPELGRADFLAPTNETVNAAFARADTLARVPGLASLVLRDIMPPGYTQEEAM